MFNKNGQLTIFIIIGILVLFVAAGVLYFTKSTIIEKITAEGEPVITDVPQAFQPLQLYTENCLSQIGKRGLLILGEQGGYIYPDLVGQYSSTNPTEADGINLEPLKVPYWHYNTEPNPSRKITFSSLQPKLYAKDDPTMSIEAQLSRFVNERIDACVDNYQPFTTQGFTVKVLTPPEIKTIVTENSVNVWLKREVDAQQGESTHHFDQFYVKIPLQLKHYYDVAQQITQAQQNYSYLERQGMELISVYSDASPTQFPPTSGVTYDFFSTLSWNEGQLKQKFQGLLVSYVPLLRFLGSENFYYTIYPEGELLAQKVVDNMVLPLTGAEDLKVNFDYFGWTPYFKTNSEQGVIKPEDVFVKFGVLSFAQQRYETHYDASYPVLVTLADENALDGEGYHFAFSLESNIRNNQPAVAAEIPAPYPRRITSLACREEQRDTKPLKTVVVDSFSKEPVELVKIGFSIPNHADCEMGLTDKKGEFESSYPSAYGGRVDFVHEGYLTNFYPIDTVKYREHGALIGYAVEGVTPEKVVVMDKIVKKKVKIKKKELKKCVTPLEPQYTFSPISLGVVPYKDISNREGERQCFFTGGNLASLSTPVLEMKANNSLSSLSQYYFFNREKDLSSHEQAIITLERVDDFHPETVSEEFTAPITIQGNQEAEVDLVPGKYKVSGMVTLQQPVLIPAEERSVKFTLFTVDTEEHFTIDESRLSSYVTGNLQWETPETYLTITPEQLYTAQGITFYVLTQDILGIPEKIATKTHRCAGWVCLPLAGCAGESCVDENINIPARIIEDLQVPGKIAEISQQPALRQALEPRFT